MQKGDKVKVLSGPHKNQVGILSFILDSWYYVRLDDGIVEFHCLENSLAKVREA